MAKLGFLFFLCPFLLCSLTHSRSLTQVLHTQTSLLNVSDSIHNTHHLLSFIPTAQEQKEEKQTIPSSSSLSDSFTTSFTLSLHSRDTLHKSSHKDYKSLTLARLERDSARVNSLNLKLDLAIKGIKKSDLKPSEGVSQYVELKEGENLQGPIISGTSQGSGEYFSKVGIGSPPKSQYLVIDTGSDVTWVQCQPCSDCYQQTDTIFEPSSSSSYASVACGTQQCTQLDVSACRNGSCLYQVSYGDGSYTVGDFVTETVTFGDSSKVDKIGIGCGHDNEGLFVGSAGLLGLGGGKLSFPTQVKSTAFSYCLVDRDSTSASTLQFGPSAELTNGAGSSVTAPLVKNHQLDTFYYIGLTGLSVGGEMLTIPPSMFSMDESGGGGVIVDSGTAITRLRTDAYNSLRDAFVKGTKNLPSTSGVALFDTCYDLSSKNSVEVPTVTFHFPEGKTWALPAKNYLIPVDSAGTFCFAFAPTSGALSIIGNVQQQGTRVSLDLGNSLVGFSPNQC
ncbi:hypothetical protein IFM89_011601 [Coptis chinensis]|uniref:Peptidase A1 domain-containing protein n=1 Tax=Coptis chinensis TaxID=261450 RepID=A0A835H7K5_9MAGN|nr:hypothetical protein IFM89_011601 [Coptis chinensis]